MENQGKGMPRGLWSNIWCRHGAVVFAYALSYALLREVTFSHWTPLAGLRFAVLLFVPYRYWPALVLGEFLPLAYRGIDCASTYGWLWASTFMVPPIALVMPVIRWFRERRRLFPCTGQTSINMFLFGTLTVSLICAAVNIATFSLMRGPLADAYPYKVQTVAGWYFLGNYIGILTIVPLVLLVREEWHRFGRSRLWARLSGSPLVLDAVCLLLPALALLVWLASGLASQASQEARIAMFLPVAWLALRHGWRGAAVGGTAASIAVMLTMPAVHDSDTLHALVFVAFTVTTMMMLGGRIAFLHDRDERGRAEARLAFALAQRNVHLGEIQLQQISNALEQMSGSIQASYTQMFARLRTLLPGTDERTYHRQAALTQHQMYRLADSLYPTALRERGLSAALREGSMPRALDEAGMAYWCDIRTDALDKLSSSVQTTLYRLSSEAVSVVCAQRNVSRIHIRVRVGVLAGRRCVALQVDGYADFDRLSRIRWGNLETLIASSGMGIAAIKDRAGVFGGKARLKILSGRSRVSIMLFDPDIF